MKFCVFVFLAACSTQNGGIEKIGEAQMVGPDGAQWAPSLSGSMMDGTFHLTGDGHFIADVQARQRFDWALSAVGEVPETTLEARLTSYIQDALQPPAQAEALDLLGRYLSYRRSGGQLTRTEDPVERLQQLISLRDQYFTPAQHQALFGDEEASTQAAIAAMTMQNSSASDGDKATAMADITAALPAHARKAHEAAQAPLNAYQQEAAMRAAGASADDINAFRTATFGAAAAARLQALDQEHAAFDAKIVALRLQRDGLVANGVTAGGLAAWRARAATSFNVRDQRRAMALLNR